MGSSENGSDRVTVSEAVAAFLAARGCTDAFTVSGAGNLRILDAIHRLGKTRLVACHHEQACAQAAIAYYRVSGRIAPVVVTCGGGAANVVTGVVGAWMDSIPLFVIAGQESIRNDRLRAYGVQGFSLSDMVAKQTNSAFLLTGAAQAGFSLGLAWDRMQKKRPGPVVIEIPMDVQGHAV